MASPRSALAKSWKMYPPYTILKRTIIYTLLSPIAAFLFYILYLFSYAAFYTYYHYLEGYSIALAGGPEPRRCKTIFRNNWRWGWGYGLRNGYPESQRFDREECEGFVDGFSRIGGWWAEVLSRLFLIGPFLKEVWSEGHIGNFLAKVFNVFWNFFSGESIEEPPLNYQDLESFGSTLVEGFFVGFEVAYEWIPFIVASILIIIINISVLYCMVKNEQVNYTLITVPWLWMRIGDIITLSPFWIAEKLGDLSHFSKKKVAQIKRFPWGDTIEQPIVYMNSLVILANVIIFISLAEILAPVLLAEYISYALFLVLSPGTLRAPFDYLIASPLEELAQHTSPYKTRSYLDAAVYILEATIYYYGFISWGRTINSPEWHFDDLEITISWGTLILFEIYVRLLSLNLDLFAPYCPSKGMIWETEKDLLNFWLVILQIFAFVALTFALTLFEHYLCDTQYLGNSWRLLLYPFQDEQLLIPVTFIHTGSIFTVFFIISVLARTVVLLIFSSIALIGSKLTGKGYFAHFLPTQLRKDDFETREYWDVDPAISFNNFVRSIAISTLLVSAVYYWQGQISTLVADLSGHWGPDYIDNCYLILLLIFFPDQHGCSVATQFYWNIKFRRWSWGFSAATIRRVISDYLFAIIIAVGRILLSIYILSFLDVYLEGNKCSFALTSRTFILYTLSHRYLAEPMFEQIPAKANPSRFFDAIRKATLTSSLVLSLTFLERFFFNADIVGLSVDFKEPLKTFNAGHMSSLSPIGIAVLPLMVYTALWHGLRVVEMIYSVVSAFFKFVGLRMAGCLLFFIFPSESHRNYKNDSEHCGWWRDYRNSLWSPFFTKSATEPETLKITAPASSSATTGHSSGDHLGLGKHASSLKNAENGISQGENRAPSRSSDNNEPADKNPQPAPTIDSSIIKDEDTRSSSRYCLLFNRTCLILPFFIIKLCYPAPTARIIISARVTLLFLNNFLPFIRGEQVPVSDFSGVSRLLYAIWCLFTSLLPFTLPQIRVPGWLSRETINSWFFHTALAGIIFMLGTTNSAIKEHISNLTFEHFVHIWLYTGIWTKYTAYLFLTFWIISLMASERLLVSLAYLQGQAKYIFWDMYILDKMPSLDDPASLMYPWDTREMIIKDYEDCPELSSPDHTRFPTLFGSLLLMQLRWPGFPSLIAVLVIWLLLKMKALHDTLWYRFQKLVVENEDSDDEDGDDEPDDLNPDGNGIGPQPKRGRKPLTHERWVELLTRFYIWRAREMAENVAANDEVEAAQIVGQEKNRAKERDRAQVAEHRAAKERVAAANDRFRARSIRLEASLVELRGDKRREVSQSNLADLRKDLEAEAEVEAEVEAEAEIEALRKTMEGTTWTPETIGDDNGEVPEEETKSRC